MPAAEAPPFCKIFPPSHPTALLVLLLSIQAPVPPCHNRLRSTRSTTQPTRSPIQTTSFPRSVTHFPHIARPRPSKPALHLRTVNHHVRPCEPSTDHHDLNRRIHSKYKCAERLRATASYNRPADQITKRHSSSETLRRPRSANFEHGTATGGVEWRGTGGANTFRLSPKRGCLTGQ